MCADGRGRNDRAVTKIDGDEEVVGTEERDSDVNPAVHLLDDGWLDAYDCAVVVGNDSDIAEAMRLVRDHHGRRIGLITPGTGIRKPAEW